MKALVMAQIIKTLQESRYEALFIDIEDDGGITIYADPDTDLDPDKVAFLKEAGCIFGDSRPTFVHILPEVLES